jgi:excisionase family DNA binding protein
MAATTEVTGRESLVRDGFAQVADAQQFLKLSRAKVYLLMDDGSLPYARFGRSRRIPWRALHAYAERCLVRA